MRTKERSRVKFRNVLPEMDNQMLFAELGTQKGGQIQERINFGCAKREVNVSAGTGSQYAIAFITKHHILFNKILTPFRG